MTIFLRSLLPPTALRSARARFIALAACLAAPLALAAPAGAVVTPVGSTLTSGSVKVGLQPRNATSLLNGFTNEAKPVASPETFANKVGEPVVHGSNVFVIYWDPADKYHGDWQGVIDGFLQGLAADSAGGQSLGSVFSVDAQYTDKENTPATYQVSFRGAYTDTHPYPTKGNCTDPHPLKKVKVLGVAPLTCLSGEQVQEELQRFIAEHQLPTGMHSIFYLLTPPGATTCLPPTSEEVESGQTLPRCSDFTVESHVVEPKSYERSFCSYHSAFNQTNPSEVPNGGPETVLYGVIPWTAGGLADGHLSGEDQTPAFDCQDGGYNPTSHPAIEEQEKAKELSPAEKKAFEAGNAEEKEKTLRERQLQGPHQEEPNQVKCPSTDGSCDTGLADLIVGQIAAEQQNIITDPLLNAWHDSVGYEVTDECRNFFAPTSSGSATASEETGAGTLGNQTFGSKSYYLNDAFNLAALRLTYPGVPCINGASLLPQFTAPSKVNAGETVGFDGIESDITLNAAYSFTENGSKEIVPTANFATFTWNFHDESEAEREKGLTTEREVVTGQAPGAPACEKEEWGRPAETPCAASVFHKFRYAGTYNVSLLVKDVAGNTAEYSSQVTVSGGARPTPGGTGGGTGGTGGGTGGTGGGTGGTGGGAGGTGGGAGGSTGPAVVTVPAPSATATVLSRTLRLAASKGLAVRYPVNQQVAGRFEVLLGSSAAHHLGISGPLAGGQPAGAAPQRVIARAVLITTRGGSSTIHILFSRATAKRLTRAHSASLELRLVVRNAAASGASTTTLITRATLPH